MSKEFSEKQEYTLNLKQIIASTTCSPTVRLIAMFLEAKGGLVSPGECLKLLPDEFINDVSIMFDPDTNIENKDKLEEDVMLISLIINHAEGGAASAEDAYDLFSSFFTLAVIESLSRKGLVEINYQNVSLTDSTGYLVKISDQGKEYVDNNFGAKDE